MAELFNLKRVKKAKTRAEAEKLADANRIKFGRSKSEKKQSKAEQELALKLLDAHKRADQS